jgi:hypothetical protein
MRRIRYALAAAGLLLAAPAASQSAPDELLLSLRGAAVEAAALGYRAEPRVFDARLLVGLLPRGGAVVVEANLRAGGRYAVIGVCDEECHDLDLRVHAPGGGQVLDEDVNTDAVPVVTFVAERDGAHPVEVVMSGCRAELCRFAVKVLAR